MPTKIVGGVTVASEVSLQDLITGIHTEIGANSVEHALKGFELVGASGTGTASTAYHTIHFLEETVITATNNVGGDDLAAVTMPAGAIIYGAFTDIAVTSGNAMCYILGTYA